MLKLSSALLVISALASLAESFDVPEPLFEVFYPKGLRVSIPDSDGIKSVQFLLSIKLENEEPIELFSDVEASHDGYWMSWKPEVVLHKNEVIYYKITVEHGDIYWNKEGEYVVEKAYDTKDDDTKETENQLPHWTLTNVDLYHYRPRGLITEGKKSSYQSSYSSYQGGDAKPITRSSTSSTTGSFVMKPTGEVEASGFKKSSTYDSTKREGEQWEFSESELSPEELDELKRFIGPNFRSFSELTAGQVEEFKKMHGSNFHVPERIRTALPDPTHPAGGTRTYEESYFSKESSSSVRNQPEYAHPVNYQQRYHEQTSAHESSSGRVKPVYHTPDSRPSSSNRYEQRRYNMESSSSVANPVALSHTSELNSDYQQSIPATSTSSSRQSSRNYEYSRGESHHGIVSTQPRPTIHITPSSSYIASTDTSNRHSHTSTQTASSQHSFDYDPDDTQTVENPRYTESHYKGSIFKSMVSSRVNSPQECAAWSETNYEHVTDLVKIQQSISKMSCLASIAEHSVKEELKLVKQQNSDLSRKLDSLEREFRRYQHSCPCSG